MSSLASSSTSQQRNELEVTRRDPGDSQTKFPSNVTSDVTLPARTPVVAFRTRLAVASVFPHSAIPGTASHSRLVTMHFLPMPCLTFGNPARPRHARVAVKTRSGRTMGGRKGYASPPLRQERRRKKQF